MLKYYKLYTTQVSQYYDPASGDEQTVAYRSEVQTPVHHIQMRASKEVN